MKQITPNRLVGLLDVEDTADSRARSAAQAEASRRNGALSRGPRTAEGKAVARRNSMRHGLLARVLSPPSDVRAHDLLYRRIRAELRAEHAGRLSFSRAAVLDSLARDMIQLARAGAMVEALQVPGAMSPDDAAKWKELCNHRELLRLVERVTEKSGGEGNPSVACPPADADRLAQAVLSLVKDCQGSISFGPDDVPEAELDKFERAELEEARRVWSRVKPANRRCEKADRVAALLRGDARPAASAAETAWLGRVLAHQAEVLRRWLHHQKGLAERLERQQAAVVARLAIAPQQLLLVERYKRAILRSVSDQLRMLR